MSRTVYSTRFAEVTFSTVGTDQALYTVPVGKVALVRFVVCSSRATGSSATFGRAGGPAYGLLLHPPDQDQVRLEVRMVFNAGDIMQSHLFAGAIDLSAHGYLLTA